LTNFTVSLNNGLMIILFIWIGSGKSIYSSIADTNYNIRPLVEFNFDYFEPVHYETRI
jgi:hypothetical protein